MSFGRDGYARTDHHDRRKSKMPEIADFGRMFGIDSGGKQLTKLD